MSPVTTVLTFAGGGSQLLAGCLALLAASSAAEHVTLRPALFPDDLDNVTEALSGQRASQLSSNHDRRRLA